MGDNFSTNYHEVTTICYLNKKVTRPLTGNYSIFAGIVLMHATGDSQAYEKFLAHVKEKEKAQRRSRTSKRSVVTGKDE